MKKVLFVASVPGHITQFHLPYLQLLKENGYEIHVATNGNEKIPFCDKTHPISVERSPWKYHNIRAIHELKKIILEEQFDLIHCHTPMASVVTRLAAKKARNKFGTKVFYTAHGFHFFKGAPIKNWMLFYPVEWYLAKYTDTLITINHEDYDFARKKFYHRCPDIQYVPGVGIDTKKFQITMSDEEKASLKESLNLKEEDKVLSCVARLDENKNQEFLINVIEELVKDAPSIHLLLVGNDELEGYYQKIVESKNLETHVHFLGYREDIPKIIAISDIIVSASKREGLPVNVMEAFAGGKPVVALECRGMKDLIQDDSFGFIVKQGEEKIFAHDIKKILFDQNLKETIGNHNLMISQNYSINHLLSLYQQIYCLSPKIPRVIHYVWMGGKPKPKNIERCMKTWNKLKGFEIKEWNETNFNIEEHPFCKKAYENKKWAFVSDYVRVWALYHYGGVYFDTDILVLNGKRLDRMLNHDAFVGYESNLMPFTAVFGAKPGHSLIQKMLGYLDNNEFDINKPNTQWVSQILREDYHCELGNKEQELKDGLHVYPKEILCVPSRMSATVHAFSATWVDKRSLIGKMNTFLRLHANHFLCRILYSKIVFPLKEKRNLKLYRSQYFKDGENV